MIYVTCMPAFFYVPCGLPMMKQPETRKKPVGNPVATSKQLPGFIFCFNISFFISFFKYKTIETHARAILPLNISAVGSVNCDAYSIAKFVAP